MKIFISATFHAQPPPSQFILYIVTSEEHDGRSYLDRKHCSASRRTVERPGGGEREKNMDGRPVSWISLVTYSTITMPRFAFLFCRAPLVSKRVIALWFFPVCVIDPIDNSPHTYRLHSPSACTVGQGAQYVGMGKDIYKAFPKSAKLTFDEADEALNHGLGKLIFEGQQVNPFWWLFYSFSRFGVNWHNPQLLMF